ncbi:D-tyrosyl-tRNA(Tyr) deacylase [Acidaminococcus sp. NSJ-142]|jgi:D-tyrosyl-tRNA(Tyr) deacylase|uniref:D-aminoacyl-tRNA deacylase n=1 Tax=Acidaminococcus hominis TaxID=2897706 RepID=UPI001E34DB9D|nr:D-aminoacyl-tRNA deacylase [Acidaminococcus hominis]MCD2434829.1 D-tyrosyl-tRNA(Tyr) deacylase [Acidaminococcus hominis]
MRAVVQRVTRASVTVEGREIGAIGPGLMVLLGVEKEDTEKDAAYLAEKITGLRIFEDENDKMNLSLLQSGGSLLLVSQFTLLGDVRHGRRPSFTQAALPDAARELYEKTAELIRSQGVTVATGQFQAHMQVELVNDGPVTLLLDSRKTF